MYFLSGQSNRGRGNSDGRFRPREKMGLPPQEASTHRGWSFHFVQHQSGTVVKHTTFHVGIDDPHGNRITHLRDFRSIESATKVAQNWVDERLRRIERRKAAKGPAEITDLPAQEK